MKNLKEEVKIKVVEVFPMKLMEVFETTPMKFRWRAVYATLYRGHEMEVDKSIVLEKVYERVLMKAKKRWSVLEGTSAMECPEIREKEKEAYEMVETFESFCAKHPLALAIKKIL